MTCLITGCGLAVNQRYLWGDLHLVGDTCVFNGVAYGSDAQWSYTPFTQSAKVICADFAAAKGQYFERRGVAVFPADSATLNEVAQDYIKEIPHARFALK